jgi:hypothetical protein
VTFFSEEDNEEVEIFLCYAHEDEGLRQELEKQLKTLQRQGPVDLWNDRHVIFSQEANGNATLTRI